jgi:hypothetical protein
VMEGVAFSMADCMDALKSSGTAIDSLLAIGGGSQSRFWVETLATVLGQPIGLLAGGENGAAMGAAGTSARRAPLAVPASQAPATGGARLATPGLRSRHQTDLRWHEAWGCQPGPPRTLPRHHGRTRWCGRGGARRSLPILSKLTRARLRGGSAARCSGSSSPRASPAAAAVPQRLQQPHRLALSVTREVAFAF